VNPDLIMAAFEDELEKIAGRDEVRAFNAFEDEVYKLAQYGHPQQQQGGGWGMPIAAGLGVAGAGAAGLYGYNQYQAAQQGAAQQAQRQAAEASAAQAAKAGKAAPGFFRRSAGLAGKGLLAGGVALGTTVAAGLGYGALVAARKGAVRMGERGAAEVGARVTERVVKGGKPRIGKATARQRDIAAKRLDPDYEAKGGLHQDGTPVVNITNPHAT